MLRQQARAQARTALETAGLHRDRATEKNELMPAGNVVSVDPNEGTSVDVEKGKKGQATLVVSAGANTVPMPNVVGSQVDAATKTLKQAGFMNIKTDEQPRTTPTCSSGEVTKQNPAGGIRASRRVSRSR